MKGFFCPSSVAIIGASADTSKIGGTILKNLIDSGFKGKIYPINVKGGNIQGLPAFTSTDVVGEHIDMAVLCVPSKFVKDEMEKLGKIGTKRAVIITAGFKEEGAEGKALEDEVHAISKKYNMRVIGPNCFGVMNCDPGLNTTFCRLFPKPGSVGLISQSGATGATILDWAMANDLGISKFASLGNKMDVGEPEILDYYRDDEKVKVIGMYCESISDGPGFVKAVQSIHGKKPMVMLKAGRTAAGSKAASSHTGALAGADSVFNVLFKKLNIVRVYDLDAFYDALCVFSMCGPMEGDGVAIVTNAGGLGVMAADACFSNPYVKIANISPETVEYIKTETPRIASVANPIDIRGDATAEYYDKVITAVSKDKNVSAIAVLVSPLDTADLTAVANAIVNLKHHITKPLVACFAGGIVCNRAAEIIRAAGVPNYVDPDRAINALGVLRNYWMRNERKSTPMVMPKLSGRSTVEKIIKKARAEGRDALTESEGKEILIAYGISVPGEEVVTKADAASVAAERIGYPVVMKVVSADIKHKSDAGGVVIGVKNATEAKAAFEKIMKSCKAKMPDAKIDGVSVQRFATGQEVILSMMRNEQFGPIISFGLGGIYVEILREISQALVPMSDEDLDELITTTKAYKMLSGARGMPVADIDALKDAICKLIKIAEENKEITEFEINPILVSKKGEGCWAVDSLVMLKKQ